MIRTAAKTIAGESKDFRVACWMCEALVREHGFVGLRDGLALLKRLCETYWAEIHPQPNEDGHLDTVSSAAGIASQSACRTLMCWPITRSPDGTTHHALDFKQASGGEGGGKYTMAEIQAAASASPPGFYNALAEAIKQSLETLAWLSDFFDDNCLRDNYGEATSPVLSGLKEELEQCGRVVRGLAELHVDGADAEPEEGEAVTVGDGAPQVAVPDGAIRSRDDALRTLARVADFFEKTEPHSPISYALRQVSRWGRMQLPELLLDLISDRNTREDLQRRVGVRSMKKRTRLRRTVAGPAASAVG